MKQKQLLTTCLAFCFSIILFAQNSKQIVAENWLETNRIELDIQPNHIKGVENISTTPQINEEEAFNIAKTHINVTSAIAFQSKKLFVYHKTEQTKLVYKVVIETNELPIGSWEVIVDANDSSVISAVDKAHYYNDKDKKKKTEKKSSSFMVNGTGFVFETDPLTATTSSYGGQYVDGNDATNASLDAARTSVTLLDITQTAGQFFLEGPYAEIQDFEAPNKGLFNQASSAFNFNRQQDGFEAVNVYYHIDKSMRYINETLGVTLSPYQYTTGVRVDPSGLNGSDQSYYLSGSGRLAFGEGCVDDAEDADVILHELAHGLHDWTTNGGLSQVNGLSEGCGDYWANSYKRSLGQWSASDVERNWVFGWDGHNTCWPGRTTAYAGQYPAGLIGQIHTDGQMWATTLMEIWEDIGREKTDKAFLVGLMMTNGSTGQEDAAIAVRQAAIDMGTAEGYTCADIQAMTSRFTAQGYTMPTYTCNLSVDEFSATALSIFPNPTSGSITLKNIKQAYTISIYNMLGQKVKDQAINSTENTIDVSNLATGAYFVKFKGEDAVLKFIKE